MSTNNKNTSKVLKEQLTRHEALKKIGKYAALTAIGTFIILNPQKAQAGSLPGPEGNPFEGFD